MEEPVSVEVTVKPEPIDHDDNKAKNDNNEESLQLSNEEIWIKPEHIEDETEDPVTEDPITEEAETNVKVESKESGEVEAAQSSNVTCNTSRPTQVQIETLLHFLEENPGIAKGHMRSAQARHQTKLKWDEVATLLNTLGGAVKDAKAWAKFWSDKKYALKKSVAQRNASATRSGGAGDLLPPFSELDERLLLVMGGCSSADGDQDLRLPLNVPLESQGPSTCQATEMKAELSGADSLPGRLQDMPNTVASPASNEKSKICLPLKKRLDKEATSDGGQGGGVKAEPGDKEPDEDGKPAPVQQPKMETPVMYSYEITKNIEIVTISEEERQVEYEETKKSRQHMRHVCEHCSLGFVLKQAYLVHMKVHSPESGEHECVLCHTRMKTADMLYRHRLRHYRRYRCLLCWTRFKDKDTAACHVMNDHAQQTFECEHCGKGFKRPQYLKRHVEQHHTKPLRLECAVCLRVFHERGWYRTHIRSHNEEIRAMTVKVPATCSICSREFKTKEGLKRHLLTHDNEDVACELCGEKCKNRNTLAQHYLKVHNEKYEGAPEQTCPQCMRVCATRVILKRHMKRMHSDRTKKYQCDHCQRLYLTKAEVRSHIAWSHLAGAARGGHACACGRVFRSPSLLRDHRARAHAPVPPPRTHACDICNKAFANKQVMNRHRKGHSNEMYPCNECGLLFKTQPYVKVHYQIKHLNMTRAEIKEQRKRNKNTIPQNNIHKSVSPEPAGSDQGQDPLIMEVEVKLEPGEAQDSVGTE